jgi:hypothetical protein
MTKNKLLKWLKLEITDIYYNKQTKITTNCEI